MLKARVLAGVPSRIPQGCFAKDAVGEQLCLRAGMKVSPATRI
jgi:hypothetical protein